MFYYVGIREGGGSRKGWIPPACEAIYVTYTGMYEGAVPPTRVNSSASPSRFLCFARARLFHFFTSAGNNETCVFAELN